jgi:hypothetical protein
MSYLTVRFDEIKCSSTRNGKCACGKRVTRSKTFYQTVNPYNRNKDGSPKTRNEVWDSVREEARNWNPVFICKKCQKGD